MGWEWRWEGGSGWGTHVHPWLIHVNVWQKPPQYCKVISLQLKLKQNKQTKNKVKKIQNNKKKMERISWDSLLVYSCCVLSQLPSLLGFWKRRSRSFISITLNYFHIFSQTQVPQSRVFLTGDMTKRLH